MKHYNYTKNLTNSEWYHIVYHSLCGKLLIKLFLTTSFDDITCPLCNRIIDVEKRLSALETKSL